MKNMMIEYAVNLKIGSTPDLVLMSTITSDFNTAKEHLERTNREIRAEKYPVHTTAKLIMRQVAPWCDIAK